jgi:hypothetical protein
MKNKLKIVLLVSIGMLFFVTCTKDPKLNMPTLQQAVIPKVTKDATKDQIMSDLNLTGFNGSVIVDLYYKDKPKSMDLMVCMNGDVANTGVVKAGITSFPTKTDFTVGNLVDWLPKLNSINEIVAGNTFKFYVDITLEDGTVVKGNDPDYVPSDPAVANLPNSSINVVYNVACGLNYSRTIGSYDAYSSPADWNSKGTITITANPTDPNTVYVAGLATIDGGNEDLGPLVMHIDPVTYKVTADKTIIATEFYGDSNYYFKGTGNFNTCTGLYTMKFEIGYAGGAYGTSFNYTFTRK